MTGDDSVFLKFWQEVDFNNIDFCCKTDLDWRKSLKKVVSNA